MMRRPPIFSLFFFNDTATTEIYTLFPTRRSSDLKAGALFQSLRANGDAFGFLMQNAATFGWLDPGAMPLVPDRKSTRLNSSHQIISYAVFCLKKKKTYVIICMLIVHATRTGFSVI